MPTSVIPRRRSSAVRAAALSAAFGASLNTYRRSGAGLATAPDGASAIVGIFRSLMVRDGADGAFVAAAHDDGVDRGVVAEVADVAQRLVGVGAVVLDHQLDLPGAQRAGGVQLLDLQFQGALVRLADRARRRRESRSAPITIGLVSSLCRAERQPVSVVASTADASATMVAERMGLTQSSRCGAGQRPVTAASPSSVEDGIRVPYGVRESLQNLANVRALGQARTLSAVSGRLSHIVGTSDIYPCSLHQRRTNTLELHALFRGGLLTRENGDRQRAGRPFPAASAASQTGSSLMKSRPCRAWRCPSHQARVGGIRRVEDNDGGDVVSTGPTTLPEPGESAGP